MTKWKVDVHLKSGTILNCYIEDEIDDSNNIAKTYFGGRPSLFVTLMNITKDRHISFRLADVSAFEIRALP